MEKVNLDSLQDKFILGIDTSTRACSVSIVKNSEVIAQSYTNYKLKHSEKLLLQTKHILEDSHLNIEDIDCFAVGVGPGSFTGLRIGAATVKGFAHVNNKPILGVSSIGACAYSARRENDKICVIFDAQRNDVYCNFYKVEKDNIFTNEKDRIEDIDCLLDRLKGEGKVLFTGDGVFKYKEKIKENLGENALIARDEMLLPKASDICLLSYIDYKKYNYDNFLPNYIRPSSAEENKKKQV